MRIFTNYQACMWFSRLVPIGTWICWLIGVLAYKMAGSVLVIGDAFYLLFIVCICAYVFLVYFIWPPLLFHGEYEGVFRHSWYVVFAGLTAGLGPCVWYFVSVDPILRKMALEERCGKQMDDKKSQGNNKV